MNQPSRPNLFAPYRVSPSDTYIVILVTCLLLALYLLSYNGRITSSDGLSMFAVTESFVKRGDLSTDQMWTFFGTKSVAAPDGEVYSKYGYGTSLLTVPLYALALVIPGAGLMQVALLAPALATVLTAAMLYLALRRLKISAGVSVLLTLLFGLATPAWVYAKEFWSEPFAALTLFAAFYFLLRYRDTSATRDALVAGICLGLALAVRTTNILFVPFYLWYGFVRLDVRAPFNSLSNLRWRSLIAFLVPVLTFLVSIFVYNFIRFGNPLTTGYRADEDFSNNILLGMYGLLFSPGKGLFVYAPFLAVLPFGIWQFWKTQRRALALIAILFLGHLLVFSAWYYWWGGTNWAARFLVPTLPFLMLLCAPLLNLLQESRRTPAWVALLAVFVVLVGVSVVNELAGVTVNSLTYRLRTVTLSPNPDWDSIFLPPLSPLIGHWQTLKLTNLDVAWLRAAPDSIQIDWWVLGLLVFCVLACAVLCFRALLGHSLNLSHLGQSLGLGLVATIIMVSLFAADPRLGGGEGYAQLLQTVQQNGSRADVLVLNDDAHARFFLNANHSPMKWYGLSRDPARWDDATRDTIAQNLTAYPRIWFAYDDKVDAPNPMRDWFASHLTETNRFEFPDGVNLVSYAPR